MPSSLDKLFFRTIGFLSKEKIPYIIIGGMAVGVLGEPRMTQDIDLIIFTSKNAIPELLDKLKRNSFLLNNKSSLRNSLTVLQDELSEKLNHILCDIKQVNSLIGL